MTAEAWVAKRPKRQLTSTDRLWAHLERVAPREPRDVGGKPHVHAGAHRQHADVVERQQQRDALG